MTPIVGVNGNDADRIRIIIRQASNKSGDTASGEIPILSVVELCHALRMQAKQSENRLQAQQEASSDGVPLPALRSAAMARITAKRTESDQQLSYAIIEFLTKMKSGGEKELGRNPSSEDLLPYFQKYANDMFDAEIRERLIPGTRASKPSILSKVVNQVVHDICDKKGVWRLIVSDACAAVDLGVWETSFGTYDRGALLHPKRAQLNARLRVHALRSKHDLWQRKAMGDSRRATNKQEESNASQQRIYPERAIWLEERLRERDSSPYRLKQRYRRAPDVRTTKKILTGLPVRPDVFEELVNALNSYRRFPPVTEDEIPAR